MARQEQRYLKYFFASTGAFFLALLEVSFGLLFSTGFEVFFCELALLLGLGIGSSALMILTMSGWLSFI